MNITAGVELIKSFEKRKLEAYQDSGGVWTVGWGSTGPDIVKGTKWTETMAAVRLNDKISRCLTCLKDNVTIPLTDNQASALVSFIYNVGEGAFKRSTLLNLLNKGDFTAAADQLLVWNKVNNKPVNGLSRRRAAERKLFLS